jgi:sugar/nucleoside kinase (ribokinase family)
VALTHYDILIPGNYFCDLIFTGFPNFPALGSEVYTQNLAVTVGGVLNTVVGLKRLGVNVGWLGHIGTDLFSRFVLDFIEKEGLDTSLLTHVDAPFQRVTVAISYPHERAFVTYIDPSSTPVEMAVESLDRISFSHLHFTGFQLDPQTLDVIKAARARRIAVSMDCQDRPMTLDTPGVRDTLMHLDMFMPNAKEAMRLAERDSVNAAAEVLHQLVPLLIIKDGANGASAWQGDAHWHESAIPVTPVDTTGAGDVFNAGFLAMYRKGQDIETCLRWGNICGGLSTLGSGGSSTAPHLEQVEAILEHGYHG